MAKIEIDDKLYEKFKSYIDEENLDKNNDGNGNKKKLNEKEEIESLIKDYLKTKKLLKFIKDNKS